MKLYTLVVILLAYFPSTNFASTFIANREQLKKYANQEDIVLLASTGRSGSTMMTAQLNQFMPAKKVLKTHLLPPQNEEFKGKIIFIFSNPDKATESALYMMLHKRLFAERHFNHMEKADREWFNNLGAARNQTPDNNLLNYDAFRITEHLDAWLHQNVKPASMQNANILAIKFERLWDKETIQAIRDFLNLPNFSLPPRKKRGHYDHLFPNEIAFRKQYNLGTPSKPQYAAYNEARKLWSDAPSFQFLKLKD